MGGIPRPSAIRARRNLRIIAPMAVPVPSGALDTTPSPVSPETAEKLRALESRLSRLDRLMVAYSGGVDSAFLAATAHRVLGDRMLAVLADSASLARRDLEQALAFAATHDIPLKVIQTEELDKPEYQKND